MGNGEKGNGEVDRHRWAYTLHNAGALLGSELKGDEVQCTEIKTPKA